MDEVKTVTTVAVSFFGILSVFFLIKKLRKNKAEKWELVGYLDEILIHPIKGCRQRYIYRVLQTIQMKLILLWVWAERAVLGRDKTALKFKY